MGLWRAALQSPLRYGAPSPGSIILAAAHSLPTPCRRRHCSHQRTPHPHLPHTSPPPLLPVRPPGQFEVEQSALEQRYKQLQRLLHPDKYSVSSDLEKEYSDHQVRPVMSTCPLWQGTWFLLVAQFCVPMLSGAQPVTGAASPASYLAHS